MHATNNQRHRFYELAIKEACMRAAISRHDRNKWRNLAYCHDDATYRNIWAQPFPYPGTLPKDAENANASQFYE